MKREKADGQNLDSVGRCPPEAKGGQRNRVEGRADWGDEDKKKFQSAGCKKSVKAASQGTTTVFSRRTDKYLEEDREWMTYLTKGGG